MSGLIVDAVTGILIHEDAVFMIRRNPALMAFPGYEAFPGGKIDPEDAEGTAFAQPELAGFDARLVRGLVRELREEIAFDLPAALADDRVSSIQLCGTALTPIHVPRRFNTYFFIIRLRQRPEFALEPIEAVHGDWLTPHQWLGLWRAGERIMAPPTLACLEMLDQDPLCRVTRDPDIESWSRSIRDDDADALSVMQSVHGLRQLFVRSNTLPPAEHTNCYVIGEPGDACVAVDPSPCDEIELARLERSLLRLGVNRILLTHHHRDHRQFADRLDDGESAESD